MLVKKREFLPIFLDGIRKELEMELPDEDYLFQMQEIAWKVIKEKIKHIERLYE